MNNVDSGQKDLNSVFTNNLPGIFRQFNISLAVSTYQAGKLILLRGDNDSLNTHFRNFNRPMGIAVKPNRIAIGCMRTVEQYHNVSALIPRLENSEKHDACYVPRLTIESGAIDIHEMAWGSKNLLWAVNTRFSCLCTFDGEHSFVSRWKPPWVSVLEPSDRCHLNGMAMINGLPRFVTALGETDTAGGWRSNKRNGGLLMDAGQNKILFKNLSMPHSPRWYNNQLWMLESGHGTLVRFDLQTGKKIVVCHMPGFTRGLDFAGNLAFVGLSKVRETATFSNFPLLEKLEELFCGVYVCNIQTGKIIGFVRFEGDVEEIFAVQVLPKTKFPELLEKSDELLNTTYVVPDESLKDFAKT